VKPLKIAVPGRNSFKDFVNATTQKVTGYCIDVFKAAVKKLPHDLDYEFNVFDGSYDEIVHSVSSGVGEPCSPCTCM
jgi:ionotropic glutamate receptor